MPDIRVIKIIDSVKIDDLANLPQNLEVLYLPFFIFEENKSFNFPITLNRLFIGYASKEQINKMKIPYLCKVIVPSYENREYYNEYIKMEEEFKNECLLFCSHQILFLKKVDLILLK